MEIWLEEIQKLKMEINKGKSKIMKMSKEVNDNFNNKINIKFKTATNCRI